MLVLYIVPVNFLCNLVNFLCNLTLDEQGGGCDPNLWGLVYQYIPWLIWRGGLVPIKDTFILFGLINPWRTGGDVTPIYGVLYIDMYLDYFVGGGLVPIKLFHFVLFLLTLGETGGVCYPLYVVLENIKYKGGWSNPL